MGLENMPFAKYNAGCGMMGSEVKGMLDEQYEQQFKMGDVGRVDLLVSET